MNREVKDIVASVYGRLKNIARQQNTDFQTILQYYGMERFLYRLSQTEHQRKFILKGGLIFNAWELPFRRITKDIDFRGFTQNSLTKYRRDISRRLPSGMLCRWNVFRSTPTPPTANARQSRIS